MAFFTKQLKSYGFKMKMGASILAVAKEWWANPNPNPNQNPNPYPNPNPNLNPNPYP